MEANLLRYLIEHEGKAVSRKAMLEEVWGVHEDTDTRAIDNFIVRLRRYIEQEPARPQHLLTVRGVGYRFIAEPASRSSSKLTRRLTRDLVDCGWIGAGRSERAAPIPAARRTARGRAAPAPALIRAG